MTAPTTRDHLIEIGLQQIHATGYSATGVKEILDLAGVPKGSFYHYFPSKEAFTEEVLTRYATAESERLLSILDNPKQAPLRRLRAYFESYLPIYEARDYGGGCLLGNLSLEIADHSPRLRALLSTSFSQWQQGVTSALREAASSDELPKGVKPDELAGYLINSWEGALVRMKADKSAQPIQTFLNFTFNVLLKK
jgi:TetR/AcrR family transcriptional repressor of nem operon